MTPIDDLHVGQWVAIVDETQDEPPLFSFWGAGHSPNRVNGQPLQIVALSLPFIALTDGVNRFAVDARNVSLKKLHRKYVQMMRGRQDRETQNFTVPHTEPERQKDTEGCCPVCSTKLIQRLRDSAEGWLMACPECGFEGGIGKDTA